MFNRIIYTLLLLGLAGFSFQASAIPIGWSKGTVNGGTVLIDTLGNEWLSPAATQGDSYQSTVTSSIFVTDLGFETVSSSEFDGLLSVYGLPSFIPDPNNNGYPDTIELLSSFGFQAKHFITDFGSTQFSPANNFNLNRTWGLLEPFGGSDPGIGAVSWLVTNGTNYGGTESGARTTSGTSEVAEFGTWLYRANSSSTVPEPSILSLIGLGIFGLGFARWKKATE